jgi:hypothetical protein
MTILPCKNLTTLFQDLMKLKKASTVEECLSSENFGQVFTSKKGNAHLLKIRIGFYFQEG